MQTKDLMVFHLDDEPEFLRAVKDSLYKQNLFLSTNAQFSIQSFLSSTELLSTTIVHSPDIILLDYTLSHRLEKPLITGADVSEMCSKKWPQAVQVLLTNVEDKPILQETFSADSMIHDVLHKSTVMKSLEEFPLLLKKIYKIALVKYGLKAPPHKINMIMPFVAGQTIPNLGREMGSLLNEQCSILVRGEQGSGKRTLLSSVLCNLTRSTIVTHVNCSEVSSSEARRVFRQFRKGYSKEQERCLVLHDIQDLPRLARKPALDLLIKGKAKIILTCLSSRYLDEHVSTFVMNISRSTSISIMVPPLRDRPEEVEELVRFWINRQFPSNPPVLSKATIDCLTDYSWENENVAELFKTLKAMAKNQVGNLITPISLPKHIRYRKKTRSYVEKQINEHAFALEFDPNFQKTFDLYTYELLSKLIKLTHAQYRKLGKSPSMRDMSKLLHIARPTLARYFDELKRLNLLTIEEINEIIRNRPPSSHTSLHRESNRLLASSRK